MPVVSVTIESPEDICGLCYSPETMLMCTGCAVSGGLCWCEWPALPLETMFDVLWSGPLRTLSGVLLQARAMFMVRTVTRNYVEAHPTCVPANCKEPGHTGSDTDNCRRTAEKGT